MKSKSLILVFGIIVAVIICGTQYVNMSKKSNIVEIQHNHLRQKSTIKPAHKILPDQRSASRSKLDI